MLVSMGDLSGCCRCKPFPALLVNHRPLPSSGPIAIASGWRRPSSEDSLYLGASRGCYPLPRRYEAGGGEKRATRGPIRSRCLYRSASRSFAAPPNRVRGAIWARGQSRLHIRHVLSRYVFRCGWLPGPGRLLFDAPTSLPVPTLLFYFLTTTTTTTGSAHQRTSTIAQPWVHSYSYSRWSWPWPWVPPCSVPCLWSYLPLERSNLSYLELLGSEINARCFDYRGNSRGSRNEHLSLGCTAPVHPVGVLCSEPKIFNPAWSPKVGKNNRIDYHTSNTQVSRRHSKTAGCIASQERTNDPSNRRKWPCCCTSSTRNDLAVQQRVVPILLAQRG